MIELKPISTRYLLITALASVAVGPALATEHTPRAGGEALEHTERGTYQGVPWISGGVGKDEREAIMSAVSDYNLKLEFANTEGNYLGDVDVDIHGQGGQSVLDVVSSGPWLLTRLPAGSYEVRARAAGRTLTETVQVPSQGRETVLFNRWSAAETDRPPMASSIEPEG